MPRWGASNEYPQHMFLWRNKKDISFFRMKKVPYLLLCLTSFWNCTFWSVPLIFTDRFWSFEASPRLTVNVADVTEHSNLNAPDKGLLTITRHWYFFFSKKTFVVVLVRTPSSSTHNICFCGEIRKIFIWYPFLSGALNCLNPHPLHFA